MSASSPRPIATGIMVVVVPGFNAKAAEKLGKAINAAVADLAIRNPESIAADYVTSSIAVVTGRVDRPADRVDLIGHAIGAVQSATAGGGNRVVALKI